MDDVIEEAYEAYERLYNKVVSHIEKKGFFSISDIQRTFNLGFFKTALLRKDLEKNGIIEKGNGINPQYLR